jgi:hypothetical protein
MAKTLIRLEGLAVFAASLYGYHQLGASWLLFAALWLVPDLSMVGYLHSPKAGALTYNLIHTHILAAGVLIAGEILNHALLAAVGLILANHIGMDRYLGFGLKYADDFKHTHVQQL